MVVEAERLGGEMEKNFRRRGEMETGEGEGNGEGKGGEDGGG